MRPLPALLLIFATACAAAPSLAAASGPMATARDTTAAHAPPSRPLEAHSAPPDDPEAHYQALLAADQASAPDADWTALRMAYAARPEFQVFAQSPAEREMFQAADKGDCALALPDAETVLKQRFIDIDAHMVAAFCEDNAGDHAAAVRDRDIGAGLIKSIETGDGLSPQAAFTVIDVAEEFSMVRALGLTLTDQTEAHEDGHAYDVLTGVDRKGARKTYYFLIDGVLAAESRDLGPRAVSDGGPSR